MPELTPSQTVGPFLRLGLAWPDGAEVVPPGMPGAIQVTGVLRDGLGEPVTDGLVETWQADAEGRFTHPDDENGPAAADFRGFGRCPTDAEGRFTVTTVKPGELGDGQAPHIDVSVFARGLLDRLVTRIYFPDEEAANAVDPLLRALSAAQTATLVASAAGPGRLRFDIHLQGSAETVFLDL